MVFHAEGTAKVYEWNGGVNSSSYVPKKQKPIYEPHLFGPLSSIYLGYKIGILELIYGILIWVLKILFVLIIIVLIQILKKILNGELILMRQS